MTQLEQIIAAVLERAANEVKRRVYPLGRPDAWSDYGKHLAMGLEQAFDVIRALSAPDLARELAHLMPDALAAARAETRAEKAEADLAAMTALKRSYAEMKDAAEAERDAAQARVRELEAQLATATPPPDAELDGLVDLIGELGREVYYLLDDCETSGEVGQEVHTITTEGLEKVSAIMDRIDALPFEEPGVILGTGAMLQAAIKQTFAAALRARKGGEA